ncbi:hypothetical protein [Ensifer sp. ENS12]|uniref:hypothetical protein n=1 Tax=Ensifer sp. ENS12 TaxID=2854774 RepID=UPI001C47E7C0|nr:hypothetical protein [Ensifer sp. ENS12]MBV7522333.1 hypothetical protein [Ensifer sp. ENS12]
MKVRFCAALAAAFTLCVPAYNAEAESLLELVAGNYPGKLADEVTADMNRMAEERIDQMLAGMENWSDDVIRKGSSESNLLLVQGGNEARMIIGAIRSQFGEEMTKQVKQASNELRPLLEEIQKWRALQATMLTTLVELEDSVAMDLERVPFSPNYFGIRRVSGTVLPPDGASTHRVKIVGPNFGSVIAGQEITIKGTIDGVDLGPPTQIPPHTVAWDLPSAVLKGKKDDDQIVTIPLAVSLTKVVDGWFYDSKEEIQQELKVVVLPEVVGTLRVRTEGPEYKWVPGDPVTKSSTISNDKEFVLQVLKPIGAGEPIEGSQRFTGEVSATCGTVKRAAVKFPKKVVLESEPLMQKGWIWHRWKGNDPVDWDYANRDVYDELGITVSFHSIGGGGRCDTGERCFLTPAELRSLGEVITTDVSDCQRMAKEGDTWSNDRGQFTTWIRGAALTDSLWTVTAKTEVYKEAGIAAVEPVDYDVKAGEKIPIDIIGFEGTVSEVEFIPRNGKPKSSLIGKSIPQGPIFDVSTTVGNHTMRYFYTFEYDTNQWE